MLKLIPLLVSFWLYLIAGFYFGCIIVGHNPTISDRELLLAIAGASLFNMAGSRPRPNGKD